MQILTEDHKLLRRKAKRIDRVDDTTRNIAISMINTMNECGGLGLSGNQVGIMKRIIVVSVDGEPKVMINPEIVFMTEETCTETEGCLSFPGQFYEIDRPVGVTVKYRSMSGRPMLEKYTGLTARCIMHEIDHLDGIVFTERK